MNFIRKSILLLGIICFIFSGTFLFASGSKESENSSPNLVVVNLADTHSSYDNYPKLLFKMNELKKQYSNSKIITLFDGDIFEAGNIVGSKTKGDIDFEFIKRLKEYGEVIINVGNHEFDFMSPAEFRLKAQQSGAVVIGTVNYQGDSNIKPATDIIISGKKIRIFGIGLDKKNTYPKKLREKLIIPDPVNWVTKNFAKITEDSDYIIVASHAGLVPDLEILKFFATNRKILFMVGAHDHINIGKNINNIYYMHNGFRGEKLNVSEIYFSNSQPKVKFKEYKTNQISGIDSKMEQYIADIRNKNLKPSDLTILGTVTKDMSVLESAMWAVDEVKKYAGVDIAFLNHTSFGSGLKSGHLKKYQFDQFMRFDNDVMIAEIDSATLKEILSRCNQHNQNDIYKRTGDFLYTQNIDIEDGKKYKIATSSWVALDFNQMKYLGTKIKFEKLPEISTKQILIKALNNN